MRPNQIIKLVVKMTESRTELMNLSNFINWVESYIGEHENAIGEVLDIQLYTLHLSGGCSTKGGVK